MDSGVELFPFGIQITFEKLCTLLLVCARVAVHPEHVFADIQVSDAEPVFVVVLVELSDTAWGVVHTAVVGQGFGYAAAVELDLAVDVQVDDASSQ